MSDNILISICIPCFKRKEYLRKTLQSIYSEKNLKSVKLNEFEVIISDNDSEAELKTLCKDFNYDNLHYYNSHCEGFMNSYQALLYGNGMFLKLHNSQELFNQDSLKILIDTVKNNIKEKPLIFYTSGLLEKGNIFVEDNFENFINSTSYLSSWSNAFGIWKEDFDMVKNNVKLNKLFPHTSLLFTQYYKKKYIVNDQVLFTTQFVKKRGGHNKFQAFTIEYPSILDEAVRNKNISNKTFRKTINELMFEFLPLLFFNVKIAKRETFSSDGFRNNIKKYFPKYAFYTVVILSLFIPFKIVWRRIKIKHFLNKNS